MYLISSSVPIFARINIVFLWIRTVSHGFKRTRLDLSQNPSSFGTILHKILLPEQMTTSFPGYSLYFEKVPWLRLVTCLLDFSRFQRCDWREGLESYSLPPLSSPTEPSREWNLQKSRCGSAKLTAKESSHSILEFNAFNAQLKGYLHIWLNFSHRQ